MALVINTNVASLSAQRNIGRTTGELNTTYNRLASGLRINSARDDAAGLSISNRFTAQIRGLNQASANANDAISLAQVAEGALDEVTNALQRVRELAVQSANDTNTTADRTSLNEEVTQLLAEIDRIANNTEFNNQTLLSGTFTGKIFHVGAKSAQFISISLSGATSASLAVNAVAITTQATANTAITTVDTAIDFVSSMRGKLGALQNRFTSVINNLSNVSENLASSRSRIQDTDVAQETAKLASTTIRQQAGVAVLSQANQQPVLALQLLG